MIRRLLLLCATMSLCASTGLAGNQVSIRLISASNAGKGAQAAVSDVADVLKKSFVFDTYVLLASGVVALPANGAAVRLQGYLVTCTGKQNELMIHVAQGSRTMLKSTVNLHDGKPLILGGFPGADGTRILVFLAR